MQLHAVVAETEFLPQVELIVPRVVFAAVDDGVSAIGGHFLQHDDLGPRAGGFGRGRQSGKTGTDHDHVPGLVPFRRKFPNHCLRRARRGHIQG